MQGTGPAMAGVVTGRDSLYGASGTHEELAFHCCAETEPESSNRTELLTSWSIEVVDKMEGPRRFVRSSGERSRVGAERSRRDGGGRKN